MTYLVYKRNLQELSTLSVSSPVGCPRIRESGPILMLIKPICLYGVVSLQKKIRQNRSIFDPPLKPDISIPGLRGGSKIIGFGQKFYQELRTLKSQIGLISIKIGPLSCFLGHPSAPLKMSIILAKTSAESWCSKARFHLEDNKGSNPSQKIL